MGGEKLGEIRKPRRTHERLRAFDIGAPAVAGDRGHIDYGAALAQTRRDRFRQFPKPIKVDRQRSRRADPARHASDVAQRIDACWQRLDNLGHALGRADIRLDESVERPRGLIDVDADDIGAERLGELADARADAGRNSRDDDRLSQKHVSPLPDPRGCFPHRGPLDPASRSAGGSRPAKAAVTCGLRPSPRYRAGTEAQR
jgi:hypothetical protein